MYVFPFVSMKEKLIVSYNHIYFIHYFLYFQTVIVVFFWNIASNDHAMMQFFLHLLPKYLNFSLQRLVCVCNLDLFSYLFPHNTRNLTKKRLLPFIFFLS